MSDYSTILSNADTLKKTSNFKIVINDNVRDILYRINTVIQNGHEIGISSVSYKLPINFSISDDNISNTEIQTNIYYKIATELERQRYKVKFEFLQNYTLIIIEWTVKTGDDELAAMKKKLMSLSRKK